jgi:hypothetical protein
MHALLLKRQQPVRLAACKQATEASADFKSVDKDAKSKGPDGHFEGSRCDCRVCVSIEEHTHNLAELNTARRIENLGSPSASSASLNP